MSDQEISEVTKLLLQVLQRLSVVETEVKGLKDELQEQKNSPGGTAKFWQTKSFEWLVKTGCVISTVLVMAAVGMNYFKEYISTLAR
ncbi:MAG: hypothetical protein ACM3TR_09775 [Caulobacteraceae bacterium]